MDVNFNFNGVTVLWDNDATLVDSEVIAMPHAVLSVLFELERRGIDHGVTQQEFDELVIKWAGKQISQMMNVMEERFGFSMTEVEMKAFCDDDALRVINALKDVQALEGIDEALFALQEGGALNSVVTSSSLLRVLPGLENNNLAHYFRTNNQDRIWSAAETLIPIYGQAIPKSSKQPEIYKYALEHTGAQEGRVVAIEDSGSGVGAAIAAGIPVIGLVAAGHIKDPDAHEAGLRAKVRDTLQEMNNGKPVTDADINARIVMVRDPREIPNAIGRLLGLDPIQPGFSPADDM